MRTLLLHSKNLLLRVLLILIVGVSASACAGGGVNSSGQSTQAQLMAFYQQWKGTPYRLGGMTKSGVDCSALVMQGFDQLFGVQMPRTTDEQASVGSRVVFAGRKPGDLVFFKTGWRQRHVGIYVGDDRFLHASSSKGVIISSLSNPYWKKHYWKTTRI